VRPLHRVILMQETNKYPTKCYRCGERCEAGEGLVSYPTWDHLKAWPRRPQGMVLVEHKGCAEKFAGTFVHHMYQPEGTHDV